MARGTSTVSPFRWSATLILTASLPVLAWLAPGCGTDAVGIEACRQVERARCDVAPRCSGYEGSPAIETDEQVRNCRDFYRDHCLLGLENTEDVPGQGEIDACVEAIQKTAACRSPQKSTMAECGVALRDGEDTSAEPCGILQEPHRLNACRWLDAKKPAGEGGGGGASAATSTATTTDAATTTTTTTGGLPAVSSASATTGGLDDDGA
jgi:hypothetical protein